MKYKTLLLALAGFVASAAVAQEAKLTPLLSKELKESPGREGLMLVVEYPPGYSDPVHRHNANGFIYVLEGSVVMQVKGGNEVTLTHGQTFYEGPDDVHVVGRNASSTKPAKLLASARVRTDPPVPSKNDPGGSWARDGGVPRNTLRRPCCT